MVYPYAVQLGDHKWPRLKLLVGGGSNCSLHFVTAVPPFSFVMYVFNIMLGAVKGFCVLSVLECVAAGGGTSALISSGVHRFSEIRNQLKNSGAGRVT